MLTELGNLLNIGESTWLSYLKGDIKVAKFLEVIFLPFIFDMHKDLTRKNLKSLLLFIVKNDFYE